MILKRKKFIPSKKILFTYPSVYSHIGWLSSHMELMSKRLKKSGFDVEIISFIHHSLICTNFILSLALFIL